MSARFLVGGNGTTFNVRFQTLRNTHTHTHTHTHTLQNLHRRLANEGSLSAKYRTSAISSRVPRNGSNEM